MKWINKNLVMLSFIVLAIMAYILDSHFGTLSGVTMSVVVGGMYTDQMQVFRRGLQKKVERAVWRYGKWSQFIQTVDVKQYKELNQYAAGMGLPKPSNLAYAVKDFEREGGIYMDIPVLLPLIGPGQIGAQPSMGSEEKQRIVTKKVAINQLRQSIEKQDNKMSKQVLQKPEIQMALMENNASKLQDWFTRRLAMMPYQAILRGYSDNITDSTYGLGSSFSVQSHPYTYVSGLGRVSFANTFNAAYETAVAAALATLADDSTHRFTMQAIRSMVYSFNKQKGMPTNIQGHAAPVIFVPPALAWQLMQDPEYRDSLKFAEDRGNNNKIWTGLLSGSFIGGAFLIVDDYVPSARISGDTGYDSTLGTVNYGTSPSVYMAEPRDSGPRKPAIICGLDSISIGYGSELSFASREDDYGQFLGEEADMIIGFQRTDLTDDDNYLGNGAGAFYENNSSLVAWFYANDEITSW